ncbi:MAG: hypothetical protein KAJ69_04375 [Thermoplasmatales archaeon]|nr:hypothetical protein [Thermoplasmatales archaeon]
MGLSLTAAAAIIGVSTLVAIGTLTGNILPTTTDIYDSCKEMKDRYVDQIQTDIIISGVTNSSNGTNYDVNITVENTGITNLETCHFNILVNGESQEFTCSNSYLFPEDVAYFNVTGISSGSKKLKVVTNNGISDYYEYVIQ